MGPPFGRQPRGVLCRDRGSGGVPASLSVNQYDRFRATVVTLGKQWQMCDLGKLGVDFWPYFGFNRFDCCVFCLADCCPVFSRDSLGIFLNSSRSIVTR